jgi:hypothetical protein
MIFYLFAYRMFQVSAKYTNTKDDLKMKNLRYAYFKSEVHTAKNIKITIFGVNSVL